MLLTYDQISRLFYFILLLHRQLLLQQYCTAVTVCVGAYVPLLPIRLVNGSNPHNGRIEISQTVLEDYLMLDGVLFVMISGIFMMPEWCVVNWDTQMLWLH